MSEKSEVQVLAYVHEVMIGCHRRSYEKVDMVFDPMHYLPLLEQKVGALDQAALLKAWNLPDEFATMRRLLESRMGKPGKRESVQILRLLETFEISHVQGAVKHLVLCRIEKRQPWLDLAIYPYLPKAVGETTKPARYKVLMSGAVT